MAARAAGVAALNPATPKTDAGSPVVTAPETMSLASAGEICKSENTSTVIAVAPIAQTAIAARHNRFTNSPPDVSGDYTRLG